MTQEQLTKKSFTMIVDDEADISKVFSEHLTRSGFNVHSFSNPLMAYEHFKYSPQDCSLVISDVRMPGMTGFQLARKVKELNPNVKVILISAFEIRKEELEMTLPNAQVDGFLTKPVTLKNLSELVEKELSA